MLITKIEKLKNGKYKIIIDDEKIITFDNVILENNLLYKKAIDSNMYKKIINDTEYYNMYDKIVKYILKRRRSEKEVREYLKYELDRKQINDLILKLKNIHLIDDVAYCNAFINDSLYLKNFGLNKIRKELLKQDINEEIIDSCLKNINNNILDLKLEKIIIKKINSNKKYSNCYLKQKILNEMINLGYSKNKIIEILENNLIENKQIIKKEFEKLYIKLSKKYSGEELFKNIKNKLLLKGFNLNEINLCIEKQKN